ncbi:hypothetical protein [Sphingomonas bacterium]|uniref:hypothetical protein n=1 Tax=Sphingomonas bacterium TaxID=1895847 RepID=UPI0015769555|nr:hypothetical protein [Sphingomonas bacterium]
MSLMTAFANDTMNAERLAPFQLPGATPRIYVDPLDDDAPSDDVVVTTRRAISRVALVATETGSRFQREGVSHDPMTWMMAPRALFGGASAMEACLKRDACMRGILLHGLSIGLDADPIEIDALVDEGEQDGGIDWTRDPNIPHSPNSIAPGDEPPRSEPRLFTATVVACDGFETVQAFHASIATEEAEIAGRLYMRMGAAMADAVIVEGFDPGAPLVAALVAPALCDTLALVAADPFSPLAAGLDLNVEQRFLG